MRVLHEPAGTLGLGEVDRDGAHAVEPVERSGRPGAGHDGGALLRERPRHREPDPLARPRDDGDLPAEPEVHQLTSAGAASSTPSSQLSTAVATPSQPSPTSEKCGRPSSSR